MRPLDELTRDRSGCEALASWITSASVPVEVIPPAPSAGEVLHALQVTTWSTLGALAFSTGGLLVDGGWLRLLGIGHSAVPRHPSRSVTSWNEGRATGFLLVGDDAAGGFFAIDGGALGGEPGEVHYLSPDGLAWEALGLGFTGFVRSMLGGRLALFAEDLRWTGWREDLGPLGGDEVFHFAPPLWTAEGSVAGSSRRGVPIAEAWGLTLDLMDQLGGDAFE